MRILNEELQKDVLSKVCQRICKEVPKMQTNKAVTKISALNNWLTLIYNKNMANLPYMCLELHSLDYIFF